MYCFPEFQSIFLNINDIKHHLLSVFIVDKSFRLHFMTPIHILICCQSSGLTSEGFGNQLYSLKLCKQLRNPKAYFC